MGKDERLSEAEIEALFGPGGEAEEVEDDLEDEPAAGAGIPLDLFEVLAPVAGRTFLAAFQDLDDFLEAPLEVQDPALAAARGATLADASGPGAHARLVLRGQGGGGVWLSLPGPACRTVLARLLGSGAEQVEGDLGELHRTALETLLDELREGLERHLEDETLSFEVALEEVRVGAPTLDADTHLVEVGFGFELGEVEAAAQFYLDEDLAFTLADHQRALDAAAAEERAVEEEARQAEAARAQAARVEAERAEAERAEAERAEAERAEAARAEAARAEAERAEAAQATRSDAPGAPAGPPGLHADPQSSCRVEGVLGGAVLDQAALPLREGDVLALDRAAGALVEVRVAGRPVAEARVVVVDDHYGLRVERLLSGAGRP